MIEAIILDIDGVIVGEKTGFNFPHPHPDILQRMQNVRKKGIPIILCTAKPHFSITDIVDDAQLNNPHITDGGAVVIDPIDNIIVEKLTIEKDVAKKILEKLLSHDVYTEFYTTEDYFIQKSQLADITNTHKEILQKEAKILDILSEDSVLYDITKLMPIAKNSEDKERVSNLLEEFSDIVAINWGLHPTALPHQFCFIVNKKTSKKDAAKKAIESLRLSFDRVLGIGDTTSDWKFLELCGYVGTLENGSDEIKTLVATKGEGKFSIGKSVDENGLLDIFSYFSL